MINYFIEFALIHLILFAIYKILLRKETQVSLLRSYLLGATVLALILPLINIPISSPIQPINVTESVSSIILPEFSTLSIVTDQPWYTSLSWINRLFFVASILVGFRFIVALSRIIIIYRRSERCQIYSRNVRHSPGLETSFTFFNWIFIDKDHLDKAKDIILHEEAHIKFGHSFDLILLNLLAIPFWWIPSIWLLIKELKQLHEYQADAYVLKSNSSNNYVRTLINNTLTKQGLILTNSFNDTPLTKRLNFMKRLKKKISPWKITSVLLMLSITIYTFSCQTQNIAEVDRHVEAQMEDEIFQVVEDPATPEGGIEEFYKYVSANLKYPDKALEKKLSGKIFVEFIIQKDGGISDAKILRGIGYGCDEEALRVVRNAPPWIPAKQKGHIVKQRMVLPITFKHPDTPNIEEPVDSTANLNIVEDLPAYSGGLAEFYNYVIQNIKYPAKAKEERISGKVFVEFMVNTDGSITDVDVLKGIGYGCDEEARRIIANSPAWIPGKQDGQVANIKLVIPITFKYE